jgi:hypothetical protein
VSVSVGLGVVHSLMEAEVEEVVGPKGKWNRDRTAKRHGHERGSMTLGGRRVEVSRPRMRTVDDEHELPVQIYEYNTRREWSNSSCVEASLTNSVALTRERTVGDRNPGDPGRDGAHVTAKTTLPRRPRSRLRANASRADASGKISTDGGRSSPASASLAIVVSWTWFGSTVKYSPPSGGSSATETSRPPGRNTARDRRSRSPPTVSNTIRSAADAIANATRRSERLEVAAGPGVRDAHPAALGR